ncbi:deoxypodophyllotoxin synthase-like, partial [Capsicum annuum]|uniref:deoxypodophyllotoxin synthase-like n=1 Tax=Capsicum annuum TaxID=4072 RepID=UPI001FB09A55
MSLKVPTIDFRNSFEWKKGSEKWVLVRDEVYKSLEEFGCFEALLDEDIPKKKLYEKVKELFNSNLEKKFGNSQNVYASYSKDDPGVPLFERLVIKNVLIHGVIENFSNLLWPEGDPKFCDLVLTYSKKLSEFEDMIRRMIFEKLGLENYLNEHKN